MIEGLRPRQAGPIDIYAALTETETRIYRRRYPQESKTMAGMIQRAHDRGMRQGMRQGRDQGTREGRADVLQQALRRRFGPLAPAVSDRLHNGSVADLEVWTESLLAARTLDDVFDRSPLE